MDLGKVMKISSARSGPRRPPLVYKVETALATVFCVVFAVDEMLSDCNRISRIEDGLRYLFRGGGGHDRFLFCY